VRFRSTINRLDDEIFSKRQQAGILKSLACQSCKLSERIEITLERAPAFGGETGGGERAPETKPPRR